MDESDIHFQTLRIGEHGQPILVSVPSLACTQPMLMLHSPTLSAPTGAGLLDDVPQEQTCPCAAWCGAESWNGKAGQFCGITFSGDAATGVWVSVCRTKPPVLPELSRFPPVSKVHLSHVWGEWSSAPVNVEEKIPLREPGTVRVVTFNIWFDHRTEPLRRMRALARIVASCDADVVALQELTERAEMMETLRAELGPGWIWHMQAEPRNWYFTALLVRSELETLGSWTAPFGVHSSMGRALQGVLVRPPAGGRLIVATSHLESNSQNGGVRQRQLQEALQVLPAPSILLGDFNWEPQDGVLLDAPASASGWVDAWHELRPDHVGRTYHGNRGPAGESRRYDRVLVRGLEPTHVIRIGTAKAEAGRSTYPSSHYGLFALFRHPTVSSEVEEAALPSFPSIQQ